MHVEQSSAALQAFQMSKAFQEIDNKTSEIGNQMTDFKIIGELGRGSYGTVYKVQSNKNNQMVVLKKISLKHMKPKQQQAALKEVQILKFMDHPHIIKYFTSFMEDESIHIVMEYAEKGDLYKLLKEQRARRKYFSEKDIWDFSYQICMAVEYLHSKNIIHRDMKCLNIFLTEDKRIKIGDLGVSKIATSAAALQDTRVGTPLYLSPELVKQQPYDFKVDVWAVGCAIYHLACLEPPFQGDNLITLGNNIVNKKHKALPQIYSNKLSNFIDKFLAKKASERPSARDAVLLIPTFVKNAYTENQQRKLGFQNFSQQEIQQSQPDTVKSNKQDKLKSVSPTKDFKLPIRKQIDEQSAPVKQNPIETHNIKIENNIPLLQLQKQQQFEQQNREKQNKFNNELFNELDRMPTVKKQSQELIKAIKTENKKQDLSLVKLELKDSNPNQQNHAQAANMMKSQSQDKIQTPKLQTAYHMQNRQSQINFYNQDWLSKQNHKIDNEIKDHALPLKNVNSNKFQNQLNSQAALQSTNEESQKAQSRLVIQFKQEIKINQNDQDEININDQQNGNHMNQQQADRGIFKCDVDVKLNQNQQQQRILQQINREMPYIGRPQTASATNNNNFNRRTSQQQSQQESISQKPGISLLRGLASKNSQDNILTSMQQQNLFMRPFSAAVPQIQSIGQVKKKSVMFEEGMKDEQSELEIINDDDGNDNDYLQFNQQVNRKNAGLAPQIFKNAYQNNQQSKQNRPTTAITNQSRVSSAQLSNINQNFRQSYDSLQNNPSNKISLNLDGKSKLIVAQSMNSSDKNKNTLSTLISSQNKNSLNNCSSLEYENQVSRLFKNNMKRQTVTNIEISSQINPLCQSTSLNSHQSQIINNHQLKDLIKNYQPTSAQSLITKSQQILENEVKDNNQAVHSNNSLAAQQEKLDILVKQSQKIQSKSNIQQLRESQSGSPQLSHIKQIQNIADIHNKRQVFASRVRQQKKITIRDLEPSISTQISVQSQNQIFRDLSKV